MVGCDREGAAQLQQISAVCEAGSIGDGFGKRGELGGRVLGGQADGRTLADRLRGEECEFPDCIVDERGVGGPRLGQGRAGDLHLEHVATPDEIEMRRVTPEGDDRAHHLQVGTVVIGSGHVGHGPTLATTPAGTRRDRSPCCVSSPPWPVPEPLPAAPVACTSALRWSTPVRRSTSASSTTPTRSSCSRPPSSRPSAPMPG